MNKDQTKFNVIGIDWHEMAQDPDYYMAAKNTETVGKFIGKELVIDILINNLDQNPKKIHAIGHSLGAHISGHIGREVKKRYNAKIGRVTGISQNSTIIHPKKHVKCEIAINVVFQVWIQQSHIFTKLLKTIKNSYISGCNLQMQNLSISSTQMQMRPQKEVWLTF